MRGKNGHKIHVSWHIAWLSAGLILGIAMATRYSVAPGRWTLYAMAALLSGTFVLIARGKAAVVFALTTGILLGLLRGSTSLHSRTGYAPFIKQTVVLQGTVSEDTTTGKQGDQRLQIKNTLINNHALPGQVWISTTSKAKLRRSDTVIFSGQLQNGFGNLPASMSRAQLIGHGASHSDVALNARDWFAGGIRKAIPEPQSSLASGYLVGQRSALPDTLNSQLKVVGLTHAVVASGYNLTILVGFARRSLLKLSKYLATLASVMMIGSFMLITGLSPSMTRAGLVTSLSLTAWYYGRKIHPLVLLPFAAALTALWNPAYVWGDLGWYLSFTSFIGVVLLAPLTTRYFWGNKEIKLLQGIFIETISAQIATLPIMIFAFGQASPYALLANMLVLPLVPLTMLLTFIGGVSGVATPSLAHLFGIPASLILAYMVKAIDWVANLPGADTAISFGASALWASYAALLFFAVILWHRTAHRFRDSNNKLIGGTT